MISYQVKYTPGPWELIEVDGLFAFAHDSGWILEDDNYDINNANARLIVASPDIYGLLKEILNEYQLLPSTMNKINTIIKKIEGPDA